MVDAISCPSCGILQRTDSQYCLDCGSRVNLQPNPTAELCQVCNASLIAGATFCGSCGAPKLAQAPQAQAVKKTPRARKPRRFPRVLIAAPFVILIGAIATFTLLPGAGQNAATLPIEERTFQDCDELRLYFPGGVSARGATNSGGFIDLNWQENPEAFENNAELDVDGDQIACELQVASYASLSCESKNTNRIMAGQKLRELERWLEEYFVAYPDPSEMTAIDASVVRNEIAQFYAELVAVPAPNYAVAWGKVVDETLVLTQDWSDLVTANSNGNSDLKWDAEERISRSGEQLLRTVTVSREGSSKILPTCS